MRKEADPRRDPELFRPLVEKMEKEGLSILPPLLFEEYQKEIGIKANKRTQATLSIHCLSSLNQTLRDSRTMIFRLGYPKGIQDVYFGLAKSWADDWSDYFFLDNNVFPRRTNPESFSLKGLELERLRN